MARLMVLGLGNIVHQDKGLGIYAVRDLHQEEWPQDVFFVDRMMLGTFPLDLDGVQGLVVLDALESGKSPGCLSRLSLEQVLADPRTVQDSVFWQALTLADLLGQHLQVVVLGLEAGNTACDLMLSDPVQEAYPGFLETVREEILSMLQDLEPNAYVQALALA